MRRWVLRILMVVVFALVAIQLVPYGRDHTNPPVVKDTPWTSAAARSIARTSCYDCHSNETKWRWYSNVAPISWLVQQDTDEGREKLNFSNWPRIGETDELREAVEKGSMPPQKYLIAHPDAKLSKSEKATLIAALRDIED